MTEETDSGEEPEEEAEEAEEDKENVMEPDTETDAPEETCEHDFGDNNAKCKLCNAANPDYVKIKNKSTYLLTSKATAKLVTDTDGAMESNNAISIMSSKNVYAPSQQWIIQTTSDGYYKLINVCSRKCLAVKSTEKNAGIIQKDFTDAKTEKWIIEGHGSGLIALKNASTGGYLHIRGDATDNGTLLNNVATSKALPDTYLWKITETTAGEKGFVPNKSKWYTLNSCSYSKYAVKVKAGSTADGANVQMYKDTRADAQLFKFVDYTDNSTDGYYLVDLNARKALEVKDSSKSLSANVQIGTINKSSSAQRWFIHMNADGSVKFINENSGMALHINGAVKNGVSNGTNVKQYTAIVNNAAQEFTPTQIDDISNLKENTAYFIYLKNLDSTATKTGSGTGMLGPKKSSMNATSKDYIVMYGYESPYIYMNDYTWYLEKNDDGTYYIKNAYTNKYLTANTSNNKVHLYKKTSSGKQKWKVVRDYSGGSYYTITNVYTNKVISSSTANNSCPSKQGKYFYMKSANTTTYKKYAQRFYFKKSSSFVSDTIYKSTNKYYYQRKYKQAYAGGTLAKKGCGICAIASAVNLDPVTVLDKVLSCKTKNLNSNSCYFIEDDILLCNKNVKFLCNWISLAGIGTQNANTAKKLIQKGNVAIFCARAVNNAAKMGYWTKDGHFLCISGYNSKTDKYYVMDSGPKKQTGWHTWDEIANIDTLVQMCVTNIKCPDKYNKVS